MQNPITKGGGKNATWRGLTCGAGRRLSRVARLGGEEKKVQERKKKMTLAKKKNRWGEKDAVTKKREPSAGVGGKFSDAKGMPSGAFVRKVNEKPHKEQRKNPKGMTVSAAQGASQDQR